MNTYTLTLNRKLVASNTKVNSLTALVSDLLDLSGKHGISLGEMVIRGKVVKPRKRLIAKALPPPPPLTDHLGLDFDFGTEDKAVDAKLAEPTITKWSIDQWVKHSDGETYSLTEKFNKQYGSDSYRYYDTKAEAEGVMAGENYQPKIKNGSKYWFVLTKITL